jgi:hypothetical protein
MSEERLAAIRQRVNTARDLVECHDEAPAPLTSEEALFLILVLDRYQEMLTRRVHQVEEIKDHLREIEWAAEEGARAYCPACGESQLQEHRLDCWLAAAIK